MVEVFKTNVTDAFAAQLILDQIHQNFADYRANFALDDCDKILRINCVGGIVSAAAIIDIVAQHGYLASVLVHDFQPSSFIL